MPFVAQGNFLRTVKINFATYKRRNSSDIIVKILDENGRPISMSVIFAYEITDNSYKGFDMFVPLAIGAKYELVIMSNRGKIGDAVTAKWGISRHENSILKIDGKEIQGELACMFEYDNRRYQNPR